MKRRRLIDGGLDTICRASQNEQVVAAHKWEPARKILLARKKLEGCNPMEIFNYDLDKNASLRSKDCVDVLKEIVTGEKSGAVRAAIKKRSGRSDLSVADQVDCLVDMATDSNILFRQWGGLTTWV